MKRDGCQDIGVPLVLYLGPLPLLMKSCPWPAEQREPFLTLDTSKPPTTPLCLINLFCQKPKHTHSAPIANA